MIANPLSLSIYCTRVIFYLLSGSSTFYKIAFIEILFQLVYAAQYSVLPKVMLVKSLLDRFQMRVGGMLMRKVLMLGAAGGGKDPAVDGGVMEGADATVVHTDLAEEHVIELSGHG